MRAIALKLTMLLAATVLLPSALGGEDTAKKEAPLDEMLLKRLPAAFGRADLVALVKVVEVGEAKPPAEGLEGDEAGLAQIFGLPNMWDKIKKREISVEIEEFLKGGKDFKDLKALKFRTFTSLTTGKELSLVVADAKEMSQTTPFKAHYRKPSFLFTLTKGARGIVFLKAADKPAEEGKAAGKVWSPAGPLMGPEADRLAAAAKGLVKQVADWENPPKLSAEDEAAARKLLVELGDGDFKVRDAATAALTAKGCAVKPLLEAAMAESKDPEVKSRAEQILAAIKPPALQPDESQTPQPAVVME